MSINPLSVNNNLRSNVVRVEPRRKKNSPEKAADTHTQSLGNGDPKKSERSCLLETIKKRVQSGYYKSSEVIEDLSDSFAKAFDQRI